MIEDSSLTLKEKYRLALSLAFQQDNLFAILQENNVQQFPLTFQSTQSLESVWNRLFPESPF